MKLQNFLDKTKLLQILKKESNRGKPPKIPKDKQEPPSFLKIWKQFIKQIPREFRSITKSHKHFILLGNDKAGKSELAKGIIEQSQNIYPFEVEFTNYDTLQFYLGPKQIIHELSLSVIKDRTIKLRRSTIQLWKRLFLNGSPTVVIAYNCLESSSNFEEANRTARLFSGKLSLLSEISKKPITLRVCLTHLDKIEGYLEFARFLKQHNIAFKIPLTSNFASEVLDEAFTNFRDEYLSLILTTTSANDYTKILHFFNELPKLFPNVEQFLRTLITGNIQKKTILEGLTFSSNHEPHSSYASFDWTQTNSNSIFYRHPMLKHQIAAASILIVCFGLVFNNLYKDRHQVVIAKKGIESLIFEHPKAFVKEVIPEIEKISNVHLNQGYIPFLPQFFNKDLIENNQHLASRIRKHILEPNLGALMLQDNSELQVLYMMGLIHATKTNRMGKHIIKNLSDWVNMLQLNEGVIKSYVQSSSKFDNVPIEINYLDKINESTPLSDPKPWLNFLTHFKELAEQPFFTGHNFVNLHTEASNLLKHLKKMQNDSQAYAISNLLKDTSSKMLVDFDKNIKLLKWLNANSDQLDSFLTFVCESSPKIPDVGDLNISQLFSKLRDIADMTSRANHSFRFVFENQNFNYETNKWVNIAATHMIERLIHNYIVANNDTQGNIFFKHTPALSDLVFESHRNEFPNFPQPIVIDGRYTRMAFEKNVRNTSESLLKLLQEMPINEEDKDRFTKFLQQELISYAKTYQENYERLYKASDIRTSTLEEIKEVLEKVLLPSSFFEHFLHQVNHHTEVFSIPTSCISILDEINHFHFLKPLISQVKNEKSPFQGYQGIIEEALKQLQFQRSSKGGIRFLDKHLTPAALISLSILRDDPDSYLNQIKDNLLEIGVPSRYHTIFVAPIMQIYQIGIKDLKKEIKQIWKELLESKLTTFFSKRPFTSTADMAATLEEVTKMTSPNSDFFKMINEIVIPLSLYSEGKWHPNLDADISLDQEIYSAVNKLTKISHLLWDMEGNPKPISLKIQSRPFEAKQKLYPAPIVSYLVTGDETFHNFNQNPTWHDIKIAWWKENSSTVVVELSNQKDSRSYRDKKVVDTMWSFFDLLNKGNEQESNIWYWELPNQFGEDVTKVALQFHTNPWKIFEVSK